MNTEENNQEAVVETAEETVEETTEEEVDSITIPKSEWNKTQQALGSLKREIKTYRKSENSKETPAGELDEARLLFLEMKGGVKTDDPDEMKLVEEWMANGKTIKQIATNRVFQAELKAIQEEKAVKNATPSSTKRGGNQQGDLATAIAKADATGELPSDFKLRAQVVNAIAERSNTNKPAWH